ncbi:hypothetical protein Lser_V15G00101 [Lactuca serriola]
MARRTQRTNPPEDVTDHRFLQFPQTLNDAIRARYITNLSLLLTKKIDIAPSFDWELATRTGGGGSDSGVGGDDSDCGNNSGGDGEGSGIGGNGCGGGCW